MSSRTRRFQGFGRYWKRTQQPPSDFMQIVRIMSRPISWMQVDGARHKIFECERDGHPECGGAWRFMNRHSHEPSVHGDTSTAQIRTQGTHIQVDSPLILVVHHGSFHKSDMIT